MSAIKNNLEIFKKGVEFVKVNKPQHYRIGQTVFNYAAYIFPDETNLLRGTTFDCFHVDSKIDIFIEELEKILLK